RGFHALWWLQYGYLQQGRVRDARRLMETIAADSTRSEAQFIHSHLAQMRAHYAIETGEPAPVSASRSDQIDPAAAASQLFADAFLAIRAQKRAGAEKFLGDLRTHGAAGQTASHQQGHYPPGAAATRVMVKQLEGLLLLDKGQAAEAVDALKEAAELETRLPFDFGPPVPPKPAHELLGEALLALGHAPQAQAQFQLALQRAPRRALSLLGLARSAAKAGDAETSREAYAELRRIRGRAD
ncbi:MAG: hypothetical protein ACRD8O_07550, partial [Bryobacteraceae bacterium]